MKRALELAREAAEHGEVPVGCVIVHGGKIIGEGAETNGRRSGMSAPTRSWRQWQRPVKHWALGVWGCDLYVTLEPCPMCAGAIINGGCGKFFMGRGTRQWARAAAF